MFSKVVHVVAIATQGRNSTGHIQWVTSYQLGFSQTGESWTLYKDTDSVKVMNKVMNLFNIIIHIFCSCTSMIFVVEVVFSIYIYASFTDFYWKLGPGDSK